jgi:hypothetical protein
MATIDDTAEAQIIATILVLIASLEVQVLDHRPLQELQECLIHRTMTALHQEDKARLLLIRLVALRLHQDLRLLQIEVQASLQEVAETEAALEVLGKH